MSSDQNVDDYCVIKSHFAVFVKFIAKSSDEIDLLANFFFQFVVHFYQI
jgi:hypothetical protein